ncbi:MAG: hypothetical protein P8X87_01635 [Candidatus Bathyarchaeota archaeon]
MRKLLRNKRGVSPVLSSLLLTVIAVAGMSIAVSATYVITNGLHDNMSERLIVEDVWFNQDKISVYVRNIGRIKIDIDAIYINEINQGFSSLELEEGQHGWLNSTYTWSPETEYHIKIVTGRGTIVADYYISPP